MTTHGLRDVLASHLETKLVGNDVLKILYSYCGKQSLEIDSQYFSVKTTLEALFFYKRELDVETKPTINKYVFNFTQLNRFHLQQLNDQP